jgi:pimeloyl-ACP methyl ester carboxylesterase
MNAREELRNGSTPTVLLVHGAFEDASSWSGVIPELRSAQVDAIATANPLRGLASDAGYIASVAARIDGPVVLVGHSYGGAVITVAGSLAANVVGLVYVSGFALDVGESVLDVNVRFPESLLSGALRPAVSTYGAAEPIVELHIDREAFHRVFAADLPFEAAVVAAGIQRPISASAFEEKASSAAWRTCRCWYVLAGADRVIHPEAQRFMATRAEAQIAEVDGSHAIAISQPLIVAEQIWSATASARRQPMQTTNKSQPRI